MKFHINPELLRGRCGFDSRREYHEKTVEIGGFLCFSLIILHFIKYFLFLLVQNWLKFYTSFYSNVGPLPLN